MTFQRDLAWKTLDMLYRSSVTYQFARYALGLKYEMAPPEAIHQVKRSVLDTLGCAIGAYDAPGRAVCEEAAKELAGPLEATAFCSGTRTSVLNATLINTFLIRFLDFNDSGGGGHNSDCMGSIFAVAERKKADGKDFMTSILVSYELGLRVRESAPGRFGLEAKGWMADSRGGLSMPCALGRMMGLNEDQMANAIGICASRSNPLGHLDANYVELSMAKNLRFGFISYDAILACTLAKKGFTGPIRIVEGDSGLRQVVYQNEMDLEALTDFSGWLMTKTRHKYMPANYVTGGHVAATIALVKEHDIKPEDVAAVKITVASREKAHSTYVAKKYPRNAESADHSSYYVNAIAIKERALGPDQYNPEKFTDPMILDLIERITVEVDPKLPPASFAVTSEITLKDGRKFSKHSAVPKGHFDDPLTDAEIEDKFSQMASKYLPDSQRKKIIDTVWNLEKVDDIGKLVQLMIFPSKK